MEGDISEKIGKILSDPEGMEKIVSIAKSLGENAQKKDEPQTDSGGAADIIKRLRDSPAGRMMLEGNEDRVRLLKALRPYLGGERRERLEKAISVMESVGAVGTVSRMV